MLKISKFTFNPFSENTFVIHKDGKAVVIDPGMYEKQEEKLIITRIFVHNREIDALSASVTLFCVCENPITRGPNP